MIATFFRGVAEHAAPSPSRCSLSTIPAGGAALVPAGPNFCLAKPVKKVVEERLGQGRARTGYCAMTRNTAFRRFEFVAGRRIDAAVWVDTRYRSDIDLRGIIGVRRLTCSMVVALTLSACTAKPVKPIDLPQPPVEESLARPTPAFADEAEPEHGPRLNLGR
jgi:hypothetical protein